MLLEHSHQPPYSVENQPKRGKTAESCSHQTPQTGEKVELMNSNSPKRESYCSLLTELNKLFFSLLLSVSRVKNNRNKIKNKNKNNGAQ
jgi:hypothetical protein